MKRDTRQPTFDFSEAATPGEDLFRQEPSVPNGADSGCSDWQEVPQARFDSWSERMQMQYCEDRDNDAAEYALSEWWREFYEERARGYRCQTGIK